MIVDVLHGSMSYQEYLNTNNISVIYKDIPKKVYGFIFNYKEYNIIVINSNLSYYKKRQTILHELAHFELNHINNKKRLLDFKIESAEDDADDYIKEMREINE